MRAVLEQRFVGPDAALEVLTCPDTERAARTPLMFVHGGYVGAWCWEEHFLPWFAAQGFPVYALSLRGHGASAGRERLHRFGIADFAEDLAAAVAALPRAPVFVGHSMGALVVQKYLERHAGAPGSPARAVFACPVPPFGLMPASILLATGRPSLFSQLSALAAGRGASREALREALFGGPVDNDKLERVYARMQAESRRALADMTLWGLPQLWRVNLAESLVLGAERDALIPHAMCEGAARMFAAQYRLLPGLGHALMLESDWRLAAQAVLDWLLEQGL